MPFKFDDKGQIVLQEVGGQKMPVYIHPDGKEAPFDGDTTVATIGRLNGEAKGHREAKEKAEGALKAFEGITDAEAARKALETVKNLKDGDLVTAGKVEEIKAAAKRAAEEQVAAAAKTNAETLATAKQQLEKATSDLYAEKIGGSFTRSKFMAEKVAAPADMMQAMFGRNFKVEEGKVVAYDNVGNKLFSRTRPGEVADFDEALDTLITNYPYKDQILKGSGASGGGASGSKDAAGKKVYQRAQFDKLDPLAQAAAAKEMREGKAVITD